MQDIQEHFACNNVLLNCSPRNVENTIDTQQAPAINDQIISFSDILPDDVG